MRLYCSVDHIVDRIVEDSRARLDPSIVEEAIGTVFDMVLDMECCDEIMTLDESKYYHLVNAVKCYSRDADVTNEIIKRSVDNIKKTILEMRMTRIIDYRIVGGWICINYQELGNVKNNIFIPRTSGRSSRGIFREMRPVVPGRFKM